MARLIINLILILTSIAVITACVLELLLVVMLGKPAAGTAAEIRLILRHKPENGEPGKGNVRH